MQAQQQLRINTAPGTAALVIFATFVLGGFGGYAIGINLRSVVDIPSTQQRVGPQAPAAQPLPGSKLIYDEGRTCTPDLRTCIESQNSAAGPTTQVPAPIFEQGRMCTPDFRLCREAQNSYD